MKVEVTSRIDDREVAILEECIASITQSGLSGGDIAFTNCYDDHDRVASLTTPVGTRTYAYDIFDQLVGATGGKQGAEFY